MLLSNPGVLDTAIPPVYQFLAVVCLSHSNFTGWLRVGVIVIGVVGSSVLPTLSVLIAEGLTISKCQKCNLKCCKFKYYI